MAGRGKWQPSLDRGEACPHAEGRPCGQPRDLGLRLQTTNDGGLSLEFEDWREDGEGCLAGGLSYRYSLSYIVHCRTALRALALSLCGGPGGWAGLDRAGDWRRALRPQRQVGGQRS